HRGPLAMTRTPPSFPRTRESSFGPWAASVLSLLLLALCTGGPARADGLSLAALRARAKILELKLDDAAGILDGAGDGAEVLVERARLALYRGDCDGAAAL